MVFRKVGFYSLLFFLLLFTFCKNNKKEVSEVTPQISTLEKIKKRGKLLVTSNYNSIDYFIYKGMPMGFQLEMMEELSKFLGVKLEFIITNDIASNLSLLLTNKCDIIANNITITSKRKSLVNFTIPITATRQVLVQRKENNDTCKNNYKIIRNLLDLDGKVVHVQKNSAHYDRLKNLISETGVEMKIAVVDSAATEQLIEMVAMGLIDYTIADENVAIVNRSYNPIIDIQTPVSFQENLAWAVNKDDDSLLNVINTWLIEFKKTPKYRNIYDKYFRNPRSVSIVKSDFYTIKKGRISKYDKEIKKYSKLINWDWRLLASLIYQESQFHPEIKGWSGAFGIMQMMPQTAKKFGITEKSSVPEQILAGVKLKMLIDKMLPKEIENEEERTKFILATYNAGFEHVMDARNLARKYGKNPNIWTDNVDFFMKMKSFPKFYNDPVVKYGYARGFETYKFVIQVIERYNHYKNIVK